MESKYKLVEIFKSIQGEGYNFGKEVVFIRFWGCNLKCPWCDTKVNECNLELTAKEIKAAVEKYNCTNIILTGGEPTIWKLDELLQYFGKEYWIGIETNGLNLVPDRIDWISCSPKFKFRDIPLNINMDRTSEFRLVVDDDSIDFINWATLLRMNYNNENTQFYLSPCEIGNWQMGQTPKFDWDKFAKVYNILKEYGFSTSIQVHKLWGKR